MKLLDLGPFWKLLAGHGGFWGGSRCCFWLFLLCKPRRFHDSKRASQRPILDRSCLGTCLNRANSPPISGLHAHCSGLQKHTNDANHRPILACSCPGTYLNRANHRPLLPSRRAAVGYNNTQIMPFTAQFWLAAALVRT